MWLPTSSLFKKHTYDTDLEEAGVYTRGNFFMNTSFREQVTTFYVVLAENGKYYSIQMVIFSWILFHTFPLPFPLTVLDLFSFAVHVLRSYVSLNTVAKTLNSRVMQKTIEKKKFSVVLP